MNDDWRLQVDFRDDGPVDALIDHLDARELEHDLSDAFHDRVIVTRDGTRVFFYAGDRDQAERAQALVERFGREEKEEMAIDLKRWHPLAEEWKSPDELLPDGTAAQLTERRALIERERKETKERGYPEFEVRADLPSRKEAERFAKQLRAEGLPVVHRWKYLLVGATDEDAAKALAERIRSEAPKGSQVKVEGTWLAVYAERPHSPFSFLGGLAE